jgi:hypothetical protein
MRKKRGRSKYGYNIVPIWCCFVGYHSGFELAETRPYPVENIPLLRFRIISALTLSAQVCFPSSVIYPFPPQPPQEPLLVVLSIAGSLRTVLNYSLFYVAEEPTVLLEARKDDLYSMAWIPMGLSLLSQLPMTIRLQVEHMVWNAMNLIPLEVKLGQSR